uniref:B30.2/SPRY domain-containing protein n=1 Tax=Branchiostoma floridae TaxID=7739 RepID=C3Z5R3_BRAFL|eukprot:XP_002596164.1 hypothetical protein BRAFLDRAFT_66106 [Branchiostoma floridae]
MASSVLGAESGKYWIDSVRCDVCNSPIGTSTVWSQLETVQSAESVTAKSAAAILTMGLLTTLNYTAVPSKPIQQSSAGAALLIGNVLYNKLWSKSLDTGVAGQSTVWHLSVSRAYYRTGEARGSQETWLQVLTGFDFRFRPVTAHSYLSLSNRNRTVAFEDGEDHYIRSPSVCERFNGASYSVLGDTPFPAVGKHYFEVSVRDSMSYSVGVALRMTPRDEHLGSNELSWCLRHTHVDGSYVTLHQGREHKRLWKGVFPVRRLGVLMDSDRGLLIFQDAERKAPLDTMYVRFEQGYMQYWCACYPERLYPAVELFHGNITVHTGYSVPKHLWNFNEDTSQGESSTWWRWYRNPSSMLSEPPYSPADIGMVTRSSEGSR